MHDKAPDPKYPRIYVDFNACGWAGGDDPCYYVYSKSDLQNFVPADGMVVCIYMESDEASVVGCLAHMESYKNDWRFRELEGSWFEVANELLRRP